MNDELFDGRHIMLYAKNHYRRSKDLMADMKRLVADRSALSPENVSGKTVFTVVCDITIPLMLNSRNPEYRIKKLLDDVLKEANIDDILSISSIISALLSFLADVETMDGDKVIINLGEPDHNILSAS